MNSKEIIQIKIIKIHNLKTNNHLVKINKFRSKKKIIHNQEKDNRVNLFWYFIYIESYKKQLELAYKLIDR
jgi:hypothetical protein